MMLLRSVPTAARPQLPKNTAATKSGIWTVVPAAPIKTHRSGTNHLQQKRTVRLKRNLA